MIGGVKVGDAARRAAEELVRAPFSRVAAHRGAQTAKTAATFSLVRSGFPRAREDLARRRA